MKPRKILFIVPYRARDLEGLSLVGYHLRSLYGHEPIFSNGYKIERKLLEYGPDAIVFDHLSWNFKVHQARMAKQLGMKVIVLPTEGLFQDQEGAVRRAGSLHNATGLVDLYLTWGDYPRNALLERNLMTSSQVQTVGCPRFDFYREPYLALMKTRAELLQPLGVRNPDAPLILWATNTPYASRNPKKMIHRQVTRARKPEAEVRLHVEDHMTQFHEHSRLVEALARRHPEWNFVVKVHPAEWINPYVEMAKEIPNLYLAYNVPIRDFLYHCDLLLQRNCTTATEAWMFSKPVLNLEFGKYNRMVREEYRSGNHIVNNLEEADEAIRNYLGKSPISAEQERARQAFIKEFYYRIDGKAGERCADLINQVLTPPKYTDLDQEHTRAAVKDAATKRKKAEDTSHVNRFKDLLGLDRDVSLRFWKTLTRNEAKSNLGVFEAEVEITPEMVTELYQLYEQVLQSSLVS
jgi:surface carbohydrate biosynthesis protein